MEPVHDEVSELLNERQKTHGEAWKDMGRIMQTNLFRFWYNRMTEQSPFAFAWLMIFVKLVRITYSPYCREHWEDIVGYVRLCTNDIDTMEERNEDA